MIKLQNPYFLLLIPVILFLLYLKLKKNKGVGIGFSEVSILKEASKKSSLSKLPDILRTLSIVFLVIALCDPVKESDFTENRASGIDIILAIDVSTSMDALDFSTWKQQGNSINFIIKKSRLDAVKEVVEEFILNRPNDRIGLVAFSGVPYLASPLTLDHQWLLQRLQSLETGMIEDGTAIGSAIASSTKHLTSIESKSKIVILLTDGDNNAGTITPELSAEAAKALGVKLYTIGAGKDGKIPYEKRGYNQSFIDFIESNFDDSLLKSIAEETGGLYFRAKDMKSLKSIYEDINKLEKTERTASKTIVYTHYFIYPLLLGFLLLLVDIILRNTLFRRINQ